VDARLPRGRPDALAIVHTLHIGQCDVLRRGHVVLDVVLEHRADPAPRPADVRIPDVDAVPQDAPSVGHPTPLSCHFCFARGTRALGLPA
jgi:hypothetical protein